MLRAVQAVKAELNEQGVTFHIANGALSAKHGIRLHAVITAIANALVSWPDKAPRQWALIDRINTECSGEGWALFVCGDGMIVIDHDRDATIERLDPYDYVASRAERGSTFHQIALGLHGMVMTEES
ncbi:hypothetical protein [Bradyrhizobium sp. 2S1]|uniref:hypothetical protein n=1 Tax=Bradyrhizobium sp. 2S1 TaxID=1404429 RepID=UPI00140D0F60|nr:hypothetical protein [Bradyrhizobium sp. 2S1]MCK7669131.1 hypothetical protein [Bradyrhizobium sp. 2S1]